MKRYALIIAAAALVCASIWAQDSLAPGAKLLDQYTLQGPKNYVKDVEPVDSKGNIMVVIEIPTGTTGKWEVASDGTIKWETKNGKPRVVDYKGGYPANYGSVTKTSLPKEYGGDGDPVDIIIPGPAIPRGSIVSAKIIGVLKLVDSGEFDDKIIAVVEGSPQYSASTIAELDSKFGGMAKSLESWFTNYKGAGVITSRGFGTAEEGKRMLTAAMKSYKP
jgi:inorganic pyrophosphatase